MKYLKNLFLVLMFSEIFAMPVGTTLIGGWGTHERERAQFPNPFEYLSGEDYSTTKIQLQLNYVFMQYRSINFDLDISKIEMQNTEFDVDLNIGVSYYVYKNFYIKGGFLLEMEFEDESEEDEIILNFGVGYPIRLSDRVFFDVSYNQYLKEDYIKSEILYSFKVSI